MVNRSILVLALGLALVLWPAVGWAQPTWVQSAISGDQTSSTPTVSTASNVTDGSTLLLVIDITPSTRTVSGVSGCGATWAELHAKVEAADDHGTTSWVGTDASAGACTVTATMSATGDQYTLAVVEIGDTRTDDSVDQAPVAETATANSLAIGPTGTTTASDELVVVWATGTVDSRDFDDAISGWTLQTELEDVTGLRLYLNIWSQVQTATQTWSATPTIATGQNQYIVGGIVTFFEASGGAAVPCTMTLLGVGTCE